MPNPLTSEERARLAFDIAELLSTGAPKANRTGMMFTEWVTRLKALAEQAAIELARTADDARDARRYRYIRDGSVPILFDGEWWTPKNPIDGRLNGPTLDEKIDAALASSKSEAAEGGEDG